MPCTVRIPMSAMVFVSKTPDSVANRACRGCRTAHQDAALASSLRGSMPRSGLRGGPAQSAVPGRQRGRHTSCSTVLLSVTQSSVSTGEQKTLCRIANCGRTHSQGHGTSLRRCCPRRAKLHAQSPRVSHACFRCIHLFVLTSGINLSYLGRAHLPGIPTIVVSFFLFLRVF